MLDYYINTNSKLIGTKIGAIFTVISLLSIFTIVIPAFSIFPGALIEALIAVFIKKESYSNIALLSTIILGLIFILSQTKILIYVWKRVRKGFLISTLHIIIFMILSWIIVHPFIFYVYWGIAWDYRSDGQLLLGAFFTFPYSSFWFLILGVLIDITKSQTNMKKG